MAKPISATIYWVDNLYGPDLQDWINRRIDEDADLIAPMRTIHNREFFHGGISPIYDQDGAHELRWTDKGPRILSSQAKPTSFHHDQHGYKGATWISESRDSHGGSICIASSPWSCQAGQPTGDPARSCRMTRFSSCRNPKAHISAWQ